MSPSNFTVQQESTNECPYCGERVTLLLDLNQGNHSYVEDCEVCCRPITIRVFVADSDDEENEEDFEDSLEGDTAFRVILEREND